MIHRNIGNTPVRVSAVSLGCWVFGVNWWGEYTDESALQLMQYAYDHGITFFDNGDAYGNGLAEERLGKFVEQVGRDNIQIGGKFGYDFYSDPGEKGSHRERRQDFSPAFLRTALERSLKRMRTDVIDVYLAHNIKLPSMNDALFEELEKVQDEGLIRSWGVSLGPAIGWREEGIDALMRYDAQAVQTVYNVFEQNPGMELGQTACATGGGILARVQDNSGILKDKVRLDTQMSENDHRKFRDQAWRVYGLKKLERIRPIAEGHGMSTHQFAIKWLLQQPGLASVTATLVDEAEIADAVGACDRPDLTGPELQQIAHDYAHDWQLGDEAHPCDLKSSTAPGGTERSGYVPPPVLLA